MRSVVTVFAAVTLLLLPLAAMADEKKPVLLDGQVSLAVPAAFTELSKEEIVAKYPRQNAPGRAFGNERRTVTAFIINLNSTVAEYPNYEEALTAMRQSLRLVPATAPQ